MGVPLGAHETAECRHVWLPLWLPPSGGSSILMVSLPKTASSPEPSPPPYGHPYLPDRAVTR